MEHDEGCIKRSKSFPCCEDQMCPCDLHYFEKLKAENARYRKALEFYAVNENWYLLENTHSIITDEDLDDLNADPCLGIKLMGGRRAREALKGGES